MKILRGDMMGSTRMMATGHKHMISAGHPLATQAGLEILEAGGNAIDAAIAVQFALAVVYPSAGNIGGGGFMVVRLAEGQTNTLDFREKSPSKSSRDMYLDKSFKTIVSPGFHLVL